MTPDHRLWIVVADGEHARVLIAGEAPGQFTTDKAFDSKDAHRRATDFGGDSPGRAFDSTGVARHAFEPRVDPHLAAKRDFLHWLADWIDDAAGRDAFDRLSVIAPARALASLQESLGPAARSRLIGTLDKDLVKIPDHEIPVHLSWDLLHGQRL